MKIIINVICYKIHLWTKTFSTKRIFLELEEEIEEWEILIEEKNQCPLIRKKGWNYKFSSSSRPKIMLPFPRIIPAKSFNIFLFICKSTLVVQRELTPSPSHSQSNIKIFSPFPLHIFPILLFFFEHFRFWKCWEISSTKYFNKWQCKLNLVLLPVEITRWIHQLTRQIQYIPKYYREDHIPIEDIIPIQNREYTNTFKMWVATPLKTLEQTIPLRDQ